MITKKYKVLGQIGKGSTSEVFLGQDRITQNCYAIKIFSLPYNEGKVCMELESFILNRLSHNSIVKALESGIDEDFDLPYIVLDYVQGLNIWQCFKYPDLSLKNKIVPLIKVADAVDYLHLNNVVHQDIRADNIKVIPSDKGFAVKMLDFGMSLLLNDDNFLERYNKNYRSINSLFCVPPEQLAFMKQVDIHSFGSMVLALFEGYPSAITLKLADVFEESINEINTNFSLKKIKNLLIEIACS